MDQQLAAILTDMLMRGSNHEKREVYNLFGYYCRLTTEEASKWCFYINADETYTQCLELADKIEYELARTAAGEGDQMRYYSLCRSACDMRTRLPQIAEDWYKNILHKPDHT